MKQSEAVQHLRAMLWAVQKSRSNITEAQLGLSESTLAALHPWIFGDNCCLEALDQLIKHADNGGGIDPMGFWNMMWIAERTPALGAVIIMSRGKNLPLPDLEWLGGWEAEDTQGVIQ